MYLTLSISFAQENENLISFPPQTTFQILSINGSITFAMGGSYTSAILQDDFWDFTGLNVTDDSSPFPMENGVSFSISAKDSRVTITKFIRMNVFPPAGSGGLEYNVSGTGIQTLNIRYYYNEWLNYSVNIDGQDKMENDGWNVTQDGWLTITGARSQVRIAYGARCPTTITTSEEFPLPTLNGTVRFGAPGTYVCADLENDTWRFENLILHGVLPMGAPHWALAISAVDSNVSVNSFLSPFGTMGGWLNFTVAGKGVQTFNANIDNLNSFPLNYIAYIDGEEKAYHDGWTVSEDDWVTVIGAKDSVSISFATIIPEEYDNLPHRDPVSAPSNSTLIYTASIASAVILSVFVIGMLRPMRKRKEIDQENQLPPDSKA